MSKYSLRPVHRPSNDLKDIYKIFVPPKVYVSLRPGTSLWILEDEQGIAVAIGKLSQSQDEIQHKVLQVTHEFKDLFGLNFSDNYILKKSDSQVRDATELILVEEVKEGISPLSTSDTRHQSNWEGRLHEVLKNRLVSPGLCIEHVGTAGETRSFKVKTISNARSSNGLQTPMDIHNVAKDCNLQIDISRSTNGDVSDFRIDRHGNFGLEKQMDTIDQILSLHGPAPHPFNRDTQAGILLIGPAGSGAKLIADRILDLSWPTKRIITELEIGKSPATSIPQIFSDCSKNQPCLIKIQHFQRLISNLGVSLEDALVHAFSMIEDARVTVLAEVESIEMSSLLLSCFPFKIYTAALDERERHGLTLHELHIHGAIPWPTEKVITIASQKTPGYTRDKIKQLVKQAIFYADLRLLATVNCLGVSKATGPNSEASEPLDPDIVKVTLEDFENARKLISPLTLTEGLVSKRGTVRWSDIGGQKETKDTVEMLFEWPLRYPEKFEALDLRPTKGLLLYGPPGCSKTMTALAIAAEAKLNFIAVQGPELLNKYVGESERNLRNIFARARSMSPCVIFFDEIDAIDSSGGNTSESGSGASLVVTLLNELDGVGENKGVFVLAATNKPWELDPALLRPGRFDNMIYVKLPDAKTRRDILQIRLDAMLHSNAIDLDMLVEQTEGCSGAEVVNLCRNAALGALKDQIHLEEAKVMDIHFERALLDLRRGTSPDVVALFDSFANRSKGI